MAQEKMKYDGLQEFFIHTVFLCLTARQMLSPLSIRWFLYTHTENIPNQGACSRVELEDEAKRPC